MGALREINKLVNRITHIFGFSIIRYRGNDSSYPFASIPYNPNLVDINSYLDNYSEESLTNRRFYNLGAGSFRHKYWTNIDLVSDWYKNQQANENEALINFDLFSMGRFPIEDNSAEVVYTSHTIEHVNDQAVQNAFNETYRILKKGSIFRITTPDTDLYYNAWVNKDKYFFYWLDFYSHPLVMEKGKVKAFNKASLSQVFIFNFASQISELNNVDDVCEKLSDNEIEQVFSKMDYESALNYCTSKCTIELQKKYVGWHMNWWNENKIRKFLTNAGFKTIYRSGYGQSNSPVLRDLSLFDLQDPKTSIYMEAVKD